jgi:hypothetical protein
MKFLVPFISKSLCVVDHIWYGPHHGGISVVLIVIEANTECWHRRSPYRHWRYRCRHGEKIKTYVRDVLILNEKKLEQANMQSQVNI